MSDSLQPHGLYPARLLCPWDFPDKNTEMDCYFLHQGIFHTQGSNPLSCISCISRQVLYKLSHWQVKMLGSHVDFRASPLAQLVKNPPAMQEAPVRFLGWEDSLEKGEAPHPSILAWRPPWTTVHGITESWTGWVTFTLLWIWVPIVVVQLLSHAWLFATLWTEPTRLLHPRDPPGKNTAAGCHLLLHLVPQSPLNTHSTLFHWSIFLSLCQYQTVLMTVAL